MLQKKMCDKDVSTTMRYVETARKMKRVRRGVRARLPSDRYVQRLNPN